MGVGMQCFAALACSFGSLIMGALYSWPSYTLDLYTSPNTTLLSAPMTELESSLVGSLPSLGAMVGSSIAGLTINTIGRQKGGVVLALPFVLSWAIIGQTSSSIVVLVARFISGIGGGAFLVFAPIFISEIAEDSIRGFLASGPVALYCLGSLISYMCGWFLSYRAIIWANLAGSVLCVVLCFLVVESPLYLLRQNREEDARQAIAKYRGATPSSKIVLEELSRMKAQITPAVELVSVKQDANEKNAEEAEKEKLQPDNEKTVHEDIPEEPKMSTLKLLFLSPASRRAFEVVATALSLQVFMGIVPVMVYANTLFAQAAPNLSSNFCSVLFAIVLTSACLITAVIADRAGRRILIISSSVMVAVTMATLGFLLQTSFAPTWMSAVVILLYCFAFNFGAGTVPYVLLSEVFVPEVQGLASMLLIEWIWFLNFVIVAVFPFASKLLGIHGMFYVFGVVAVVNAVVSYLRVPETKGLSNVQIQEALLGKRK
ncbi:solute carrier family 2, facilitated glucose transporter member 8-like [Pectinophora gossypiella]|uniref:solute carrier family 2, facilitated glucose transporter member 8-like n=1 Tax=Pectinophora gossypiella TaxID=13191 RepID=UPI00214E6F3B|nr:solute carrier family 2, facilitated glucose transporter member 8-like [Pectinophora gossypiella]